MILQRIYMMTGDRRYLKPIPGALKWFEDSIIEIMPDGRHKMARFNVPGSNLPIYKHWTGEYNEEGYETFYYNQDPSGNSGSWGGVYHDVKSYIREYERVSALTTEEAKAEYKAQKAAKPKVRNVDPKKVTELISSLNKDGAWIEELRVRDMAKTMLKLRKSDDMRPGPDRSKTVQGISTRTFMNNMTTFINYIGTIR